MGTPVPSIRKCQSSAPKTEPTFGEYRGWWRITETSQWLNGELDILGTALISIGTTDGRLRMHCLLARVKCKATKAGVSFTGSGAWEFDQMSGLGRVNARR